MSNTSDSGLHIQPLPKLGQEVGRFLIENELPRGGQARVYRAWQTDLQRPVALKLLPSSYAANLDTTARFKREIENVARISHPNVVRVYEAGEVEGHPFFTMELIDGHDAETLIKRGAIDPDEGASIIEAVARGVEEAHQSGIIHRVIKPGNVILRKDDTPVLTDFGLAQDLTHSEQLTQTGISMGTPAYMAPEQARGERNRVGKKSDIYALGATLFTLLTGKRPAEGTSTYELMLKVAESQGPKWPRQALEDVPPDL
ncbi:MAG: serine/threonine protein kinase, partial [Planctomycetes bacterium]|nr:serine/threonine protein kinase [Planctomycetota bacterium]